MNALHDFTFGAGVTIRAFSVHQSGCRRHRCRLCCSLRAGSCAAEASDCMSDCVSVHQLARWPASQAAFDNP